MMGSSLCWADSSGVADDPSLRTWTNKNTGSTVEARPVALNMKTVKLVTTAKKPITMPLEKLSDEDRAYCRMVVHAVRPCGGGDEGKDLHA